MKILISGADRGLGRGITKLLLERGHTVFAGQFMPEWNELENLKKDYPENLKIIPLDVGSDESVKNAVQLVKNYTDTLDVLISNSGITGRDDNTYDEFTDTGMMLNVYNVNAVGAVRLVENFLPLVEKSTEKKLIFVSSEAGSVTQCKRTSFFWYCMSKSALNMYVKVLFNRIRQNGFRFRLYHPGWVKSYMSGKINDNATYTADEAAVFAMDYFFDKIIDEDTLVLRGYDGELFEF